MVVLIVAIASTAVAPAIAQVDRQRCPDTSMGQDCASKAAIVACCCQTAPEVPARVPDRTPAPVPALDPAGVWQGVTIVTDVPVPSRTVPRYGYASTDLFTLFSTFLI